MKAKLKRSGEVKKLWQERVRYRIRLWDEGYSVTEIAYIANVSQESISQMLNKYKDRLTRPYPDYVTRYIKTKKNFDYQ